MVCGALRRGDRLLMARRPVEGLFGGMWELPGTEPLAASETPIDPVTTLTKAWQTRLDVRVVSAQHISEVRHILTHMRLVVAVFEVQVEGEPVPVGYTGVRWIQPADPGELGLSTLSRKCLSTLDKPGVP